LHLLGAFQDPRLLRRRKHGLPRQPERHAHGLLRPGLRGGRCVRRREPPGFVVRISPAFVLEIRRR
jgi:hypothetical protein